ncbi:hypothetical protein MSAN_02057800 [Mycena sanguinolenta]|uniref:Tyr recombinase domain-containing protein n=1 Tax=Mycena sanguinolenta TaxID=230812 RepID=A0A8H7CL37_9AGAR|nr:hypothetical protein MSAN_02057800 [Mycena sanguinolenta]
MERPPRHFTGARPRRPSFYTPSRCAGGSPQMIFELSPGSRQPPGRKAWTTAKLVHERAIALGYAINKSTCLTYTSALNSYINFCTLHKFPIEPTEDTMSFFVIYMCHHIKPDSVDSYLSGICNQLESAFPNVLKVRASPLVRNTLKGGKRLFGRGAKRKRPLSTSDLLTVERTFAAQPSMSHDDKLFVAILFCGFDGLLRLGELTWPDAVDLRNWKKVTRRSSVKFTPSSVGFFLPGHKADKFFEGNQIIISSRADPELDTVAKVRRYLASRDSLFPFHPALWVRKDGTIPTRSWFIACLRKFFDKDIAGHSMRAGGATSLAEAGVPPDQIRAIGRWASDAFQCYIRKNPTLMQSMLHGGRSAHDGPAHGQQLAFPVVP